MLRLRHNLAQLPRTLVCATPGMPPQVCRGLYLFWVDGLFIALSFAFYNAFLPLFILGFGASNSQVGLMSGLSSSVGILAYLLATRATAVVGGRKRIVVFVRVASRFAVVAIALVPLVASGQAAVYLTIGLICLLVLLENLGSPAWTALVADIVPMPIRARYIASRTTVKALARTVAVAAAGWLIRSVAFPGGYQASFITGAVVGLGAALAYSAIPVDSGPEERPSSRGGAGFSFTRPLLLYVAARAVWSLGYFLAAPFYSVYVVRQLGGDESTVGMFASVSSVMAVLGLVAFSRLVEKRGLRSAWLMSGLLESVVPWLWAIAPGVWFGVVPSAVDGLLLAGLELVNLNTMLMLTPAESRTQFIAVNSAILGTAAMLGPLIGGGLSDVIGFAPVFGLAGVLSLAGCVLYCAFVTEPVQPSARLSQAPDSF